MATSDGQVFCTGIKKLWLCVASKVIFLLITLAVLLSCEYELYVVTINDDLKIGVQNSATFDYD